MRNLLDVSPPSLCDILSGLSGTPQHFGREKGGRSRDPDSNVADAVVREVLLSPLRRRVTAVFGAGALYLAWRLPRCCRARKLDSKLAYVVLEVRVLPPSRWATAVVSSGVAGALFSNCNPAARR